MFFDADDLLSNRIVEYVSCNQNTAGFYAEFGYRMTLGANKIDSINEFYKQNGNVNILSLSSIRLPWDKLSITSKQEHIVEHVDREYLHKILGSHQFSKNYYSEQGTPLSIIPFQIAIWLVGNLENHSNQHGTKGSLSISLETEQEFSIPEDYMSSGSQFFLEKFFRRALKFLKVKSSFRNKLL
jgi:hypothetical protein